MKVNKEEDQMIGLVPAAGFARRISPIPCSKEIYPIETDPSDETGVNSTKVVASCLLESMERGMIEKAYLIIRNGKWDIPAYFCKESSLKLNVAYLVETATPSVPHTIDFAYPFIKDYKIAFGFPDILIKPETVFIELQQKLRETSADVVLGLYPADNPQKVDMVKFNEDENISDIIIKPTETDLTFTWLNAVWTPAFSGFLHTFISQEHEEGKINRELYLGDIFRQAIKAGLNVETVKFPDGSYLDIGTPGDLKKAREFNLL